MRSFARELANPDCWVAAKDVRLSYKNTGIYIE